MSETLTELLPHNALFHVINPTEANTYFFHGSRLLHHDTSTDSRYFEVPYRGKTVIRQEFGTTKGKTRGNHHFEKSLMKYYCYVWSSVTIPPIVGVSRGNTVPPFIIYDVRFLGTLHTTLLSAQSRYSELSDELRVTGQNIWHLLSQRHGIALDPGFLLSDSTFIKDQNEPHSRDLWSSVVERFNLSVRKLQDDFGLWKPR